MSMKLFPFENHKSTVAKTFFALKLFSLNVHEIISIWNCHHKTKSTVAKTFFILKWFSLNFHEIISIWNCHHQTKSTFAKKNFVLKLFPFYMFSIKTHFLLKYKFHFSFYIVNVKSLSQRKQEQRQYHTKQSRTRCLTKSQKPGCLAVKFATDIPSNFNQI
jgi:succinate dehydrogenase hydrophobic anchor subunit